VEHGVRSREMGSTSAPGFRCRWAHPGAVRRRWAQDGTRGLVAAMSAPTVVNGSGESGIRSRDGYRTSLPRTAGAGDADQMWISGFGWCPPGLRGRSAVGRVRSGGAGSPERREAGVWGHAARSGSWWAPCPGVSGPHSARGVDGSPTVRHRRRLARIRRCACNSGPDRHRPTTCRSTTSTGPPCRHLNSLCCSSGISSRRGRACMGRVGRSRRAGTKT